MSLIKLFYNFNMKAVKCGHNVPDGVNKQFKVLNIKIPIKLYAIRTGRYMVLWQNRTCPLIGEVINTIYA